MSLLDRLAVVLRDLPDVLDVVGVRIPKQLDLVRRPVFDGQLRFCACSAIYVIPLTCELAARAVCVPFVIGPAVAEDVILVDLLERQLEMALAAGQVTTEWDEYGTEAISVDHVVEPARVDLVQHIKLIHQIGLDLVSLLVVYTVLSTADDVDVGDEVGKDAVQGTHVRSVGEHEVFAPTEGMHHALRHGQRSHVRERFWEPMTTARSEAAGRQ
jgi:hypothetical protein